MSFKKCTGLFLLLTSSFLFAEFPNATRNSPYPLYSSIFPYSYLATKQKASLRRFLYSYPVDRFRISFGPFGEFANRARDNERNVINIGDINGRWNMLGLFYDPAMRAQLFGILGINQNDVPSSCLSSVTDPKFVDPNREFGFFTIPMWYRKGGARFESELLLIDKCYYAVGLRIQCGLADVRQTVMHFNDLTCQALGIACPVGTSGFTSTIPTPQVEAVTGITPPYVNPNSSCISSTPCLTPCFPQPAQCATPLQQFSPCENGGCCFTFDCDCKSFVIENIMKQKNKIADFLGLDINNYHKIGIEDLRLSLFWREIFIINQESELYPRLLFMPFAEVGFGIPMQRAKPVYKPFAVPVGNNGHASISGIFGWTLDFLDTIDITCTGGFSYFFKHDYCNYRLPTQVKESGIFPYSADITLRPGPTWFLAVGMNAYRFLDLLSVWAEYVFTSHSQDKIHVCKSFIPSTSIYYKSGFLVERAEALSKWESQLFNIGFNYDLSDHLLLGVAFQIPIKQRNAYTMSSVIGSLSLVY